MEIGLCGLRNLKMFGFWKIDEQARASLSAQGFDDYADKYAWIATVFFVELRKLRG